MSTQFSHYLIYLKKLILVLENRQLHDKYWIYTCLVGRLRNVVDKIVLKNATSLLLLFIKVWTILVPMQMSSCLFSSGWIRQENWWWRTRTINKDLNRRLISCIRCVIGAWWHTINAHDMGERKHKTISNRKKGAICKNRSCFYYFIIHILHGGMLWPRML